MSASPNAFLLWNKMSVVIKIVCNQESFESPSSQSVPSPQKSVEGKRGNSYKSLNIDLIYFRRLPTHKVVINEPF